MTTVVVSVTPEYEALIVTDAWRRALLLPGLPALTMNVAVVDPLATVTLAGRLARFELELDSDTTAPPEGAGAVNVTVPVPDWPFTIVLGLTLTLLSAAVCVAGLTITLAVMLPPEYEAVSVTGVGALILPAVTAKVPDVAP